MSPMANFHSCRLVDPGKFGKFRYKKQNGADVVMGMAEGGEWKVQAIRYPKESFSEAEARSSCGKHGGSFEGASGKKEHSDALLFLGKPMEEWPESEALPACFSEGLVAKTYAKDLRGVEIFSAGTWNGDSYNESDLDAMVSAFHSLGLKPPLKLGHDEAQRWFGQKDGAPALGWVANLRRLGRNLVGDLVDVPDALHGMIESKRYRTKSAEIYWDYKDGEGRIWPRVLRAVALLGADLPAVTSLQDLQVALMADGTRDIRAYGSDGRNFKVYQEEPEMDKEQIRKYEDRIAELEKLLGDEKKRANDANVRAEKAETDAALKVFTVEIDALVKEGRVLPAEVEGLKRDFADMGIKPRKYGDKEMTWGQNKIEEIRKRPKVVEFKATGTGGDDDAGDDAKKPNVHELTVKIQRERGISYSEARDIVRIDHPEAWAEYVGRGKK